MKFLVAFLISLSLSAAPALAANPTPCWKCKFETCGKPFKEGKKICDDKFNHCIKQSKKPDLCKDELAKCMSPIDKANKACLKRCKETVCK